MECILVLEAVIACIATRSPATLRGRLGTALDRVYPVHCDETSCDETFATFTFKTGVAKVRETAAYVLSIYGSVVPGLNDPSIHGFVYREPVGPVLLIPP